MDYYQGVDHETSERDLLAACQALDPEAWELVYRRSHSKMREYARRRLPSGHNADDAVAECLARAVRKVGELTDHGLRVEAWLYGILRLVVLEHSRVAGKQARESSIEFQSERLASAEQGPLEQVLDRELTGSVRIAFERLSGDDQELLWLRLVADLSAAEVGKVVGRREGAIRQAQSRALTRLRRELEAVNP